MAAPPSISLRLATPADAAGCLAIYAPIVAETTSSFEVEPLSDTEFAARMTKLLETWPWIIAERSEVPEENRSEVPEETSSEASANIAGYAYAGPHRQREAYLWCTEVSAYVHPEHRRNGLGHRMYAALFDCLRAQGFYNAYAGITLPNEASVGFHRAAGFRDIGTYDDIGFKMGGWHSVSWYQLRLQDGIPSAPPRALTTCREEIAGLVG